MTLKELIKSRYSVRSFTDEMVGIEKIKEILDIANSAPSGGNIQPWKVYVVNGNSKNIIQTNDHLVKNTHRACIMGVQSFVEHDSPLGRTRSSTFTGNRH